jgi:predicted amidohydrolase YtcJ
MVIAAASYAFTGGRILTMDPTVAQAQVVITAGERMAAVGERGLLQAWPDAEVIDLGGRILLPGFIDAHNHLSLAALHPRWADLSKVRSLEDLAAALHDQAACEPDADWVRGVGWQGTQEWLRSLTRQELDTLGLDRPVIVAHSSLHMGVVCSQGLQILGIGRATPDPHGGLIGRRLDGQPTGLLLERAWSQAQGRSLAAYSDPDRWGEHILTRMQTLLQGGVTCVHDAACPPAAENVYRRLAASGSLAVSVLMMPHPAALLSSLEHGRLRQAPTGEGDEWLRVGPIKLFADGGVFVDADRDPAIDAHRDGKRFTAGIKFPGLVDDATAAAACGFQIAVHAMGNAGLQSALQAFEAVARAAGDADHRFRVEHVTLASPAQLRRLAELGAVGVVQPGFLPVLGSRISHLRFQDAVWMPFADLTGVGVRLAASSDDPCADWQPLTTSTFGATRWTGGGTLGPDQALGYEDWLRAWTIGAAFAGGQEHERGSLTAGKRADLVMLDGQLDPQHPPTIAQTWIAGRQVYPQP